MLQLDVDEIKCFCPRAKFSDHSIRDLAKASIRGPHEKLIKIENIDIKIGFDLLQQKSRVTGNSA